jgi:hypothetical protein
MSVMNMMSEIVSTVKSQIESVFDKEHVDRLARDTRFIPTESAA